MSNDEEKKNNRDEGQVVFWSTDKAYGFIKPNHGERDVFFHLDGCDTRGEEPRIGDRVTYEVSADRKPGKVCAKQVRFVIDDAPAGMFETPGDAGGAAPAARLTSQS
jgi:cold shock CspA family protein